MLHLTTVEVELDQRIEPSDAAELMEAIAPTCSSLVGLRHKHFVLDADRVVTGGVYGRCRIGCCLARRCMDAARHQDLRQCVAAPCVRRSGRDRGRRYPESVRWIVR